MFGKTWNSIHVQFVKLTYNFEVPPLQRERILEQIIVYLVTCLSNNPNMDKHRNIWNIRTEFAYKYSDVSSNNKQLSQLVEVIFEF